MIIGDRNELIGTRHIISMEQWDADYFNMEIQAFIKIDSRRSGSFQFGLVQGNMDIRVVDDQRLEFTWAGNDENDEASGSGWIKLKEKDIIEGEFRFHNGDDSKFVAKRVKSKKVDKRGKD